MTPWPSGPFQTPTLNGIPLAEFQVSFWVENPRSPQCASMLGDGMVAPALAFAILGLTGHVSDLGLVLAAGTGSQVLFMLAGGVIADWLPRNVLMLGSDLLRTVSQGTMAVLSPPGSEARVVIEMSRTGSVVGLRDT